MVFFLFRINIIDNVLNMVEKYATDLEHMVQEKNSQLMDEMKKADRLLYRMLPVWVWTYSPSINTHLPNWQVDLICNSTIISAAGDVHVHSRLLYGCTTGFTRTDWVSHILFSECLMLCVCLVHSPGLCGTVYVLSVANCTFANWSNF